MRPDLITDRLLLRDVTVADGQKMLELDCDPGVVRLVGLPPATDLAWYIHRIESIYVPIQSHPWYGVRLVHALASGQFLGWVFARPATGTRNAKEIGWTRDDEIEVGYRYFEFSWGQGIATEAASTLIEIALADPKTSSIVATADSENTLSLRVLEKLGFIQVGQVTLAGSSAPTVKLRLVRTTNSA